MMRYKDTYYYSLMDAIKSDSWNPNHSNDISAGNYHSLYDIIVSRLHWGLSAELQPIIQDNIVNNLFNNYIVGNNLNEYVSVSEDNFEDNSLYEDKNYNLIFGEFWRLFIARLEETYPRYKTLIELYQSNQDKLLQQIKNTSMTIFNDTPQSKEDWSKNEFASNISKYESETDIAPLISRLEEVRQKWDNLFKEWYHSFDDLFLEDN